MDFALTEDQRMLEESARKFFEEKHPLVLARRPPDWRDPPTQALWRDLAQMGFLDLLVPAEQDGLGMGLVEGWLVLEAAGRSLLTLPLAEAMLLWPALGEHAGPGALRQLALQVRQGNVCAPIGMVATWREGDLLDAMADTESLHLLTTLPTSGGAVHMQWNLSGASLLAGLEPSRELLAPTGPPASRLALPALDMAALELRLGLLRAASSVGVASRALDLTCTYANERIQFGKPIGMQQALKHRLANHWMALDNARLAGLYAASALDTASPDAAFACAAAIGCAAEAAQATVADAIQVHGALGFSWEHDAHLFFKRVMHLSALQGPVDQLVDRIWSEHPLARQAA